MGSNVYSVFDHFVIVATCLFGELLMKSKKSAAMMMQAVYRLLVLEHHRKQKVVGVASSMK